MYHIQKRFQYALPDGVRCELIDGVMYEFNAPTLVQKRDLTVKPYKYEHAGCREYWIVDPDTESVFVYFFEDNSMIYHYTFNDKVPVMISGGTCEVDFSRIRDSLSWFQK